MNLEQRLTRQRRWAVGTIMAVNIIATAMMAMMAVVYDVWKDQSHYDTILMIASTFFVWCGIAALVNRLMPTQSRREVAREVREEV